MRNINECLRTLIVYELFLKIFYKKMIKQFFFFFEKQQLIFLTTFYISDKSNTIKTFIKLFTNDGSKNIF